MIFYYYFRSTPSFTLFLFLLVFSILNSCAKEREVRFAQGEGINLKKVSQYDGALHTLKTGAIIANPENHPAETVDAKSSDHTINYLQLVSYETDASLLGDIPFKGLPNEEYTIKYELNDHYLRVLKVASREKIPTDEQPYSEILPDGRLAVPLVGYKVIGYYNVERRSNEYDEKTRYLREVSLNDKTGAKYVKIDFTSRKVFEPVQLANLFPVNFFEGEWFFNTSVSEVSEVKQNIPNVGMSYLRKEGGVATGFRLKFLKDSEHFLRAVDTTIASGAQSKSINLETVLRIPVRYLSPQTESIGSSKGLTGTLSTQKYWRDRDMLELDYKNIEIGLPRGRDIQVNNLTVRDDYLGITLFYPEKNEKRVFSFVRVESKASKNYKPRVYFEKDERYFGYFSTVLPEIDLYKKYWKSESDKYYLLNRMNPETPLSLWSFNLGADEYYKDIGRQALQLWSNAFRSAGVNIELKDSGKEAAVGDIRHNVINFYTANNGSGNLYGYGPSIADPKTGEILSGSVNVFVRSIEESFIYKIRSYIQARIEGFDEQLNTPDEFNQLSPETEETAFLSNSKKKEKNQSPLNSYLKKQRKQNPLEQLSPEKNASMSLREKRAYVSRNSVHSKTVRLSTKDIQDNCPEIEYYIEHLKESSLSHNDDELELIQICSKKLSEDAILATTIHEIGHAIGLKHNFKASSDKLNFYDPSVTETEGTIASSSIMEYQSNSDSQLMLPGLYDIEALRFGYSSAVKLENEMIQKIDEEKSLDEQKSNFTENIYKMAYCDDFDRLIGNDPFCEAEDSGTTAQEKMHLLLKEFARALAINQKRGDRTHSAIGLSMYLIKLINDMKRLYDEWRFKLAIKTGFENKHLERYDIDELQELTQSFSEQDPVFKDYNAAANIFVNKMLEIAFLPNHYCRLKDENGDTKLLEFNSLRKIVYAQTDGRESVQSCQDEAAFDYYEQSKLQFDKEFGFEINSYNYEFGDKSGTEEHDVTGIRSVRETAMLLLTASENTRFVPKFMAQNFFPSPKDDLSVLIKMEKNILGRLILGLDDNGQVLPFEFEKEELPKGNLIFQEESDALMTFIQLFSKSHYHSELSESIKRFDPWAVIVTNNPNTAQAFASNNNANKDPGQVVPFTSNLLFATKPHAYKANRLLSEIIKIPKEGSSQQSLKNLEAITTGFTTFLSENPVPEEADLREKLLIKDLFAILQRFEPLLMNLSIYAESSEKINQLFANYQNFSKSFQSFLQSMPSEEAAREFSQMSLDQISVATGSDLPSPPIDKKTLESISDELKKLKTRLEETSLLEEATYSENRHDIETQRTLLQRLLQSMVMR